MVNPNSVAQWGAAVFALLYTVRMVLKIKAHTDEDAWDALYQRMLTIPDRVMSFFKRKES